MSHTQMNNRVNETKSQTKSKAGTPAKAADTRVPVKVEDLEARMSELQSELSKAKLASQQKSENLTKVREQVANQRYVVATQRFNIGKADAEDLQIIASRKASDNASEALAKFFAKEFEETEEQKQAWASVKGELGTVTSAIAETLRIWNKGFDVLYKNIGITSKKALTPTLLKGLCPFMQVAAADGLKAALPGQRVVKKNGKAVKKHGNKVYKYTLTPVTKWNAENLYKVLLKNHQMTSADLYTADELKTRTDLLNAEVSALKALKTAKDNQKSDDPYKAADAAKHEDALKQAAKAAGKASKDNASTVGSKVANNKSKAA